MSDTQTQKIIKLSSFFAGLVLSLSLSGLSIYKISQNQDNGVWIGILSGMCSLWLPSPIQLMTSKQTTTSDSLV